MVPTRRRCVCRIATSVVRKADLLGLHDTLLWNGRIYAKDLYVAGNVDFIWGKGSVFFDGCEIKTVGRKGYIVQSRNEPNGYGYVFVDPRSAQTLA